MVVGDEFADTVQPPKSRRFFLGDNGQVGPACGTLGCNPAVASTGFFGFGLGYHLGYGYGGNALGVGPDGGYPFYGGPGYPHCWPTLRRLHRIVPFPYYGGPGYPSPENPNYFGATGPLVSRPPVVTLGTDRGESSDATGYGSFTGTIPYPEAVFAPFTATRTADAPPSEVRPSTPTTTPTNTAPAGEVPKSQTSIAALGIDAEPVVEAGGARGVKISKVYPGAAAEKAGLRVGDVIRSINGYPTVDQDSVAWVITNAAPNNVLKMNVHVASDDKEHTITAQLP